MSGTSKMNSFLQRMLKSSNEELNDSRECQSKTENNESMTSSLSPRGGWIKKLGNYSPTKYKLPSSPLKLKTMKSFDSAGIPNAYETTKPKKIPHAGRTSPIEMPDLESIIREFETGFLSPTKHEVSDDGNKQRNFVKKIVAAFEVKYKAYNDLKTEHETKQQAEEEKRQDVSRNGRFSFMESSKRRSGLFSPFKSTQTEPIYNSQKYEKLQENSFVKTRRESTDEESGIFSSPTNDLSSPTLDSFEEIEIKRESGIFSSPQSFSQSFSSDNERSSFSLSPTEIFSGSNNRRSGIFVSPTKDEIENRRKSIIFVTPTKSFLKDSENRRSGKFLRSFERSASDEMEKDAGFCGSPSNFEEQTTKNMNSYTEDSNVFKFEEDETREERRSGLFFNSFNSPSSFDDTKSLDDLDLDVTLPEPDETISTNTRENDSSLEVFPEYRDKSKSQKSNQDKTPKIVGAFLKKPIEVENTSIDWIPITGKKLPRKRSLKKLLSLLIGKKSYEKKDPMFIGSVKNLHEESREFQDSGYDEKSCSSSSLTSLASITDVLLQQENSYVEKERRTTSLKTFRSQKSLEQEEKEIDEAFYEDVSSNRINNRKKLILNEVPRESIKLELGPTYPSTMKMMTMSLDRRVSTIKEETSIIDSPKYVAMRKIPKHPFLSEIPKHPFVSLTKMDEALEFLETPLRTSVEFHKSCEDLSGCARSRTISTSRESSNYDVPRKYLSKSDTEISDCFVRKNKGNEPVYDIPRPQSLERPRSSVYEDALSLKRRSAYLRVVSPPDFYAFDNDVEPHYATVKPRNRRIHLSEDMLKFTGELYTLEKSSSF